MASVWRQALAALFTREEAPALETRALTTLAAIEALAPDWAALEARAARPVFFQSAAFVLYAARHFAADPARPFAPLVVTVRQHGALVAVAALKLVARGPVRLALDLTDPFGQYGDILSADTVDADAVLTAIVRELARHGADGLLLRRVRADSPFRRPLAARGFLAGESEGAPFVALGAYPDFDGFHRTVNVHTRKNLRNLRNRIARAAPPVHRVYAGPERARKLEESFERRLEWLADRGLTSTAFAEGGFRRFVTGLAEPTGGLAPRILAMGLEAGTDVLALQWGFVHGDRYYAYLAARNAAYDAVSPGRLLLEDVMRTVHAEGLATVDLLAPAVPYKLSWTETVTDVTDIAVPFSLTGRLVLDLWNRRARPFLRRRFLALPLPLRRVLAARIRDDEARRPGAPDAAE
jgi:CelD/BcsL family acetyltransferase involved in cellulose biosynthesis